MNRGLPERTRTQAQEMRSRDVEKRFVKTVLDKGARQLSIPVNAIEINPNQPRKDLGDLSELVASIKEKGILEPVIVRRRNERYQIVAGERRYRAFMESGREEKNIPCILVEADDKQALEISLIENLHRKNLSVWEEAEIFKKMSDELNYTQQEIASRIGKSKGYVSEIIGVNGLPEKARINLGPGGSDSERASQSLVLQAVRAQKGQKLDAFMDMYAKKEIGSVKEAKKAVDRLVKSRGGRTENWITFRYGRYKLTKSKKGIS